MVEVRKCSLYSSCLRWGWQSPKASLLLWLVAQSCPTLCDPMDCSLPGSFVHGDSPGKHTGVGCHALLQGIFPTQGLNQVSCIAGGFFTVWATREAQESWSGEPILSPGDLPDPGIELGSLVLQAGSLPSYPLLLEFSDSGNGTHCSASSSCKKWRTQPWDLSLSHPTYPIWELLFLKYPLLSAQSWPALCDSVDYGPPGPSVHGILHARILEWVAILFSRGSSLPRDVWIYN